jgi:hypothetical protein
LKEDSALPDRAYTNCALDCAMQPNAKRQASNPFWNKDGRRWRPGECEVTANFMREMDLVFVKNEKQLK